MEAMCNCFCKTINLHDDRLYLYCAYTCMNVFDRPRAYELVCMAMRENDQTRLNVIFKKHRVRLYSALKSKKEVTQYENKDRK